MNNLSKQNKIICNEKKEVEISLSKEKNVWFEKGLQNQRMISEAQFDH